MNASVLPNCLVPLAIALLGVILFFVLAVQVGDEKEKLDKDDAPIVGYRRERGEAETLFCLTIFFGMLALFALAEARAYLEIVWGLLEQILDGLSMAGGLGMVALFPGGPLHDRLVSIYVKRDNRLTMELASGHSLKAHTDERGRMYWTIAQDGETLYSRDGEVFVEDPVYN